MPGAYLSGRDPVLDCLLGSLVGRGGMEHLFDAGHLDAEILANLIDDLLEIFVGGLLFGLFGSMRGVAGGLLIEFGHEAEEEVESADEGFGLGALDLAPGEAVEDFAESGDDAGFAGDGRQIEGLGVVLRLLALDGLVRGVVVAEAGAADGGRFAGFAGIVGVGAGSKHEGSFGQGSEITGQRSERYLDYEISVRLSTVPTCKRGEGIF